MTTRPMILAVDDDASARGSLVPSLRRRFGRDYEVVVEGDPRLAYGRLERAVAEGQDVALVLAAQWMQAEHGTDFLGRTRDIEPTARRMVMTDWADFSALHQIARASTLGDLDHYTPRPLDDADEGFLAAVGLALAAWGRDHGRFVRIVTILGERWDVDAQQLRDTLERWGARLRCWTPIRRKGGAVPPSPTSPAGCRLCSCPMAGSCRRTCGSWPGPTAAIRSRSPSRSASSCSAPGRAGLSAAVCTGPARASASCWSSRRAWGGQASASPMIRNYLGFPDGLSGSELVGRAWEQAWRFGVRSLIGRHARVIRIEGDERIVDFDDGSSARARSVVIASGLAYRRLGIPSLDALMGRGVFYGSGATEAQAMAGEPTVVVGGANSAGQAAINLARYARPCRSPRGDSLVGNMSRNLDQAAGEPPQRRHPVADRDRRRAGRPPAADARAAERQERQPRGPRRDGGVRADRRRATDRMAAAVARP